MRAEASREKTSIAARRFVMRGEELSRKGYYAAAERTYQRALSLVEQTLGLLHPNTAEVLDCYAELLAKTGRHGEAIALKNRAQAAWKACCPRFCRTYPDTQQYSPCWQAREGAD